MGRDLLLFGLMFAVLILFVALGAVIGVFSVTEDLGLALEEPPPPPPGAAAVERIATDLRGCLRPDHPDQRIETSDHSLEFRAIASASELPGVYRISYSLEQSGSASFVLVRRVVDDSVDGEPAVVEDGAICGDVVSFEARTAEAAILVRLVVVGGGGAPSEHEIVQRFE